MLAVLATLAVAAAPPRRLPSPAPAAAPDAGASPAPEGYAQSLSALNEQTRAYERDPQNHYTYCVRTEATYECLSYGPDGQIQRAHPTARAHGTGFCYQQLNGESYLLTNQHVAEWPPVTDATHTAGDVPAGCKLTRVDLKIVDNESDDYEPDDIPLTEVVADPALDAAILKTKAQLHVMPYPIGKSSELRVGDAVVVKGFPLGVFRAITTGQVINTYDHDETGNWDHDDFIVDAPLSEGNSGSPVLAISNRTGSYELVGLFHAHYVEGQSLNAVIAIEQLRDLMTTLKRTPRNAFAEHRPGAEQRADVLKALGRPGFVPFFDLGPRLVELRRVGEVLVFAIYAPEFPQEGWRDLLLVDAATPNAWGGLSELWVSHGAELAPVDLSSLDAKEQGTINTALRRLHTLANDTLAFRALKTQSLASRQSLTQFEQLKKVLAKNAAGDAALSDAITEVVTTLRNRPGPKTLPLEGVEAHLAPPPPPAPDAGPADSGPAAPPLASGAAAPSPTTAAPTSSSSTASAAAPSAAPSGAPTAAPNGPAPLPAAAIDGGHGG